ncbi:MAG: tetratricopeptide repeat protein [Clostridia bacterium]|nr:tetratricopeptide repeat protein [Clostridia bacterium]
MINVERILEKLDSHLHKNDYESAERHLLYWLEEGKNSREEIPLLNELMGLYRKVGREEDAIKTAEKGLDALKKHGISDKISGATTYLNSATVFKAFGKAEEAIPLFERAREIYEKNLDTDDTRLGGLYNNMALALVDLKRFNEAKDLYLKAISVMEKSEKGALEVAITYLNMASAVEEKVGLLDGDIEIQDYLKKAEDLIESFPERDGYYAFVCEKCATVFGYYGHFYFENELKERAKKIYEGT